MTYRPGVVAVGTALLVGHGAGDSPADAGDVVELPADGSLHERLLEVAGQRPGPLAVVTTDAGSTAVRSAVRFCRSALRTDRVFAHVVVASPFRLAVLLELARQLPAAGPAARRWSVLDGVQVLAPMTCGVVVARTVGRLRDPAPTGMQRVRPGGRRHVFLAEDGGRAAPAGRLRRVALAGPWPLPATPAAGRVSVWVAPSPRPVPIEGLLAGLRPVEVVTVEPDPLWWGARGAPVTEIVVVPADLRLTAEVPGGELRPWRCYWCREPSALPTVCPRCGADGRATGAARPPLPVAGPPRTGTPARMP